ncbi:MAG: radical SAM protein [Deltaproteobacteria bacterium]|nr:radical SAM protein [Deltaproteobacteria bacterium]
MRPFTHPLDLVPRVPKTCIWEITGACNLRCVHCENRSGEAHADELSLARMLEVADELSAAGCRMVDLTGGEPLMRRGWQTLCRRLRELGLRVALVSNGLLLDGDAISEAVDAGVELFSISIDGLREVHDRTRVWPRVVADAPSPFELAMAAIDRLAGRRPLRVITQLNRQNVHQLPSLWQLLGEHGVERWQLQLAVPEGRLLDLDEPYVLDPQELPAIADFILETRALERAPFIDVSNTLGYFSEHELSLRRRTTGPALWLGCQGGIRSVAITYTGKVRGCSAMPAAFDAGDLHTQSFEEIWRDADRFGFSTRFDASQLTGACASCEAGNVCRAGCTAMAFCVGGSIYENRHCLRALEAEEART